MSTNGSTTVMIPREPIHSSQLLSNSMSSLSGSSSRTSSSQISKIYRQASTLFLTRRLPESLSTILPVIVPDLETPGPAPIASSSRTTRIKVWSLYLTILNAIVELEPDEGKQAFGGSEWRALCTKVRDGQVWEEVVRDGYNGIEGEVDSDVVINLATLLLAHARTQTLNQQRLENYLATSATPNLDIGHRLQAQQDPRAKLRRSDSSRSKSGTDTPRDLNARVKILELYTLHVLLRNNEWEYSREFINNSEVLDEERREAFLQALQSLQDEQLEQDTREAEAQRRYDEQLQRDIEEDKRRRIEDEQQEKARQLERERSSRASTLHRAPSEVDYGIDDSHRPQSASSSTKARSATSSSKPRPKATLKANSKGHKATASQSGHAKKAIKKAVPATFMQRTGAIFSQLHKVLYQISQAWSKNPMILIKMITFIVAMLAILGKREVRERVKRLIGNSWDKVRATAGMGVKVSYI